jgi:iron(III) transport system substrate-binding protein
MSLDVVGRPRRFAIALAGLVAIAALLLASSAASSVSGGAKNAAPAPKPYTAAQWRALVKKAKNEGKVVYYSGQTTLALQRLGDAFKKKYGIDVVWNRVLDAASSTLINTEVSSGHAIADVWELSAKATTTGALRNGWAVDARGPALFTKAFNRKKYMYGKSVIVTVGFLGMAWNTQLHPARVKDITDFLTPAFANKRMGVPDPAVSSAVMDFYLWLQDHYGKNILNKLAAQHPRIYLGVQPLQQAIESGEITGAPYSTATVLTDKDKGAPINFAVPKKGAWNVPLRAMVLKQAPHPAAAQLLVNFMASREGQAAVNYQTGAIYPKIADTYYVPPRDQKLSNFTPKKIAAFQAKFNSLFR